MEDGLKERIIISLSDGNHEIRIRGYECNRGTAWEGFYLTPEGDTDGVKTIFPKGIWFENKNED